MRYNSLTAVQTVLSLVRRQNHRLLSTAVVRLFRNCRSLNDVDRCTQRTLKTRSSKRHDRDARDIPSIYELNLTIVSFSPPYDSGAAFYDQELQELTQTNEAFCREQ